MRTHAALSFYSCALAASVLPAVVVAFPSADIKAIFEPADVKVEHAPVTPEQLRDCVNHDMQHGKLTDCGSLWLTNFDHDFKNLIALPPSPKQLTSELPYQRKYAVGMQKLTEALEKHPHVRSLVLEKTDLSGLAVATLAKGLAKNKTGVHSLAILGCTIGDAGAKAVAGAVNSSSIVRLNVQGNKITQDGANELAYVHDQLTVFNKMPLTEKALDLSHFRGLSIVEATVLREVLRSESPIESLDLGAYAMNPKLMAVMGFNDASNDKHEL